MSKKNKKKGKRHRNLALAEFIRDTINGVFQTKIRSPLRAIVPNRKNRRALQKLKKEMEDV
jgi:hypothetical protein